MQGLNQKPFPGAGGPPGGLLGRIVAFVVGIGVLLVSLFLGFVFISVIAGFILIIGLAVAGRVWWIKRKIRAYARQHGDIDAEYTVIEVDRIERDGDDPDQRGHR